jgi:diguanylate cyclase (GGDEF)-like protein/PAS domain S-box-containing protein
MRLGALQPGLRDGVATTSFSSMLDATKGIENRMTSQTDVRVMTQVRAEQVRMIFEASPFSQFSALVVSTLVAVLLWPVINHAVILTWIVLVYLIIVFRLALTIRFRRADPHPQKIEPWARAAQIGAFLAALSWGSASYFLFAVDSLPHQGLLAFVIAGITAGGVTSLAPLRWSAIGFAILVTVPLMFRFSDPSHPLAPTMSVMVLLFALFMVAVANRNHRNLTEMIVQRFERQLAQQREHVRNQVLELLAKAAPLNSILEAIVLGLEKEDPAIRGSILLLDASGKQLFTAAAPSLPKAYNEAVDGVEVGPGVGSCGTAAFTRRRVIIEDIARHPFWQRFRKVALEANLGSAWSEPVFAASGKLLGTFAVYRRTPHRPSSRELSTLAQAANLAGIAIERSKTEEALRLAAMVYENSSEAMMVTDENDRIVAINPAFTETTGYQEGEVLGQTPRILNSGHHNAAFFQSMWEQLERTGQWQGEIWNRRKSGEEFPEWLTINTIHDPDGRAHRRVALFSDVTEKKKADSLIWSQANYDLLTELPNRRLFFDRLEHGIKRAARDRTHLALLYIDLDRFKEVNDTLGHQMGDELLLEASQRIRTCVRESDTVARLGGDEFAVIVNELKDVTILARIAEGVLSALAKPYRLGEDQAFLSASVGITVYPDDGARADVLLKNADQAMFAAKQDGRNRFHYFTAAMQEAAHARMRMVRDLHQALEADQFSVHYQPIVHLATGRIDKAEALVRWKHPAEGFISPARFIPVAEETGAIHEIGNRVFKEATRKAQQWRASHNPNFQVSVNRSPVQFLAGGPNEDDWLAHLQEIGMPGQALVIEITEGVLLKATVNINEKLLRFRDAGIQVAIDDFGTGYSSLAYLKRFDIDYLKIDQTFVSNLETDPSDRALSEAIVVMSHKLGFKVIAEGVETEGQKRILEEMGCDYAQGYLFSRPVPAEAFDALLQAAGASPVPAPQRASAPY